MMKVKMSQDAENKVAFAKVTEGRQGHKWNINVSNVNVSMIHYRFKRYCVRVGLVCFILGIAGVMFNGYGQEKVKQEKVKKEIVIKVKHNIIALPAGEVARVPLSAARVRSTELRELNKKYNAITIEKLFKLKEKSKKLSLKGFKGVGPVEENASPIDLSKLFTKKLKKKFVKEKKEVEEAADIYLIQLQLDPKVSINSVVSDYSSLDVVIDVKEVIRKE